MRIHRGSSPRYLAIGLLALLSVASALGCSERTSETPSATPSPLTQDKDKDKDKDKPEAPEPSGTPPPPAPAVAPAPGWSELVMRDTLPFCVFSSYPEREKASLIERVKKQTLKANAPVIFGVFGPWCLNAACDERPTLQCWTEREGNDLIVHTRYSSLHKDGSSCTTECLELNVSCETPALEPGTYTVRHGDKTRPLVIPSVQRSPCLFEAQ